MTRGATTEFVQLREKPHNPLMERLNTTAFGLVRHSKRTDVFLEQTGYTGACPKERYGNE